MTERTALRIGLAGCLGGLEALGAMGAIDAILTAERAGLDGVWVNEEHLQRSFTPTGGSGSCLAPLTFLSFLAARSTQLRLGTTVLLLPLHHPLRLAEETATLQLLSGGRLELGVSPGHPGPYFEAFGVDVQQRYTDYDQTVCTFQQLWAGDTVDATTSQSTLRGASLSIRPDRPPRVYRGAYSDNSLQAAARTGTPLIQHLIQSPDSLRHGREVYRSAAPDPDQATTLLADSPVSRFVYLTDDDADADRAGLTRAEQLTERLRRIGIDRRGGITLPADLDPNRFAHETAIVGTPTTVIARLRELGEEVGTTTINCNLGWFGATTAPEVKRGLHLLTATVIPALTTSSAASPASTVV